jgi:hypothetical protein
VTRMKGAGIKFVGLHESGRIVCTGRPISGRNARSKNACKWQECMQVTGMHASGGNTWAACMWQECMQEYKYDEPPRRHAQVKGTPNQHRGGKLQEQIKKQISAFLDIELMLCAHLYACCGNAFRCYMRSEEC